MTAFIYHHIIYHFPGLSQKKISTLIDIELKVYVCVKEVKVFKIKIIRLLSHNCEIKKSQTYEKKLSKSLDKVKIMRLDVMIWEKKTKF